MLVEALRSESRAASLLVAALGLTLVTGGRAQVPAAPLPPTAEWATVDRILGREGKVQPGDVHRYSFPRGDLRVVVHGVAIKPALALGSWLAFQGSGNDAMAMGDLVLLDREVGPVITRLRQSGVEQTALHNHLLGEAPRVMYMHVQAHGPPGKIAEAVHSALALTGTPLRPPAAGPTVAFPLDTGRIRAALGYGGAVSGGVYQVSVARAEAVRAGGRELPPSMGVATAINFQPTEAGKAAVTGDFVLTAKEVNPVIQALRGGDIEVTAVHSHMLDEEPRLIFLHYWANADAVALARTLRGALDRMNVKKSTS